MLSTTPRLAASPNALTDVTIAAERPTRLISSCWLIRSPCSFYRSISAVDRARTRQFRSPFPFPRKPEHLDGFAFPISGSLSIFLSPPVTPTTLIQSFLLSVISFLGTGLPTENITSETHLEVHLLNVKGDLSFSEYLASFLLAHQSSSLMDTEGS